MLKKSEIMHSCRFREVRLVCMIGLLLLTGCVYIPGEGEKPFGKEGTFHIKPGQTTRTDILLAFGDPTDRFENDKLFIYSKPQYKGFIIFGIAPGAGGAGSLTKDYYLVVEFDETGIAVAAERITNEGGMLFSDKTDKRCTKSGYCLAGIKKYALYPSLFAPPERDTVAKQFKTDPKTCTIYVAVNSSDNYFRPSDYYYRGGNLLFGGEPIARGLIGWNANVFYRHRAKPGQYVISIEGEHDLFGNLKRGETLSLTCAAENLHFVEIAGSTGLAVMFQTKAVAYPRLMSEAEGRRSILGKKLVIDATNTLPFRKFQ